VLPEDLDPPDRRVRILRWVVVGLLGVGFGACIAKGADNPADPQLPESRIAGFGEVGFRIVPASTAADLTPTELCALLAATEAQRARGLMRVTDLKGYPGMVFRFSTDSAGGFYMRNTPMPLSIAFFDNSRRFVSAIDMAPCPDIDNCPTYAAAKPYRYALEVPRGGLPGIGAGPGSVLTVGGACA
jgi:uncharacterized membrane protein (UPF0127 family)